MRKILTALTIVGLTYFSANAQTVQKVCGSNSNKVCRFSSKGRSCYATRYAENFKVCKNNHGYFICCESLEKYNSTHPQFAVAATQDNSDEQYKYQDNGYNNSTAANTGQTPQDMIAPQSQSYPSANMVFGMSTANTYEGYYPKKDEIKVCYSGDNVGEDNRMPYQGCPSPQYDGPERNAGRNINANSPKDLPPINGWGYR